MKKFLGNIYIFFALLLISLVAVPWNDFSVWGVEIEFLSILTDNEFYIKFGILGFIFIIGLIYLLIANKEFKKDKKVSRISTIAVMVPFFAYAVAFLIHLTYVIYSNTNLALGIGMSNLNSVLLIAGGGFILLTLIFAHIFIKSFKKVGKKGRITYFIIFFIYAAISAGAAYYFRFYEATRYETISAKYVILIVPLFLVLYIIHLIIVSKKATISAMDQYTEEEQLDEIILTENAEIVAKTNKANLNEELYQEVKVDPEFSKQNKQRSKPNSIEYYIEKPKMFKPLNPTFDKLVSHVREFPDVISKLEEDKITFYVARRPFLVLMNYGDYYRLAFRYELEEGIRLIIKYPTISKNKSTREELWFKANNYGDLPKEVIYKIVKNAYDVVAN